MFTQDDARNNQLLASLSVHEFDQIKPELERVSLITGQVLHQSGYNFEYVYFPTTALVTLLYLTESGTTVGVGMIGNEGLIGIEIFMHADSAPSLAVVQTAGIAYRMRAGAFQAKCASALACQDALLRYTQALITQISQGAACNRFHSVQQRFARWLLESSDHLGSNRLAMTHEQVASALGVQRASVTIAARNLKFSGIIKVGRGRVTILDRRGLEFAACECYKVASAEYDRLLERGTPLTVGEAGHGQAGQARHSAIPESTNQMAYL